MEANVVSPSLYQINQAKKQADGLRGMAKNPAPNMDKIKQSAIEFEGMFLSQMLENLFEDTKTNELFGGGEAEDIYRSMMLEEYGKLMAKAGGIGVADHVMRQMLQMQGANAEGLVKEA
jgi:Rod binding domain-containing protein